MRSETFLDGRVTLHAGDCMEVLPTLEENSVDSVVCDPPYHLTSIVKRFGAANAAAAKDYTGERANATGAYARASAGFMGRKWDAPDAPAIDPGFAYWFAGFADGEGCFSVHKKTVNDCETYDCQFSITLRDDDRPIILEIQRQLGGIGSVAMRPAPKEGNGKPQVRYCVSSKRDCQRLREILNAFPMRAKKVRDFEIWSHALDAWLAHEPKDSWEEVAYFRDALMAVRQYGAAFHPSQLWTYRWAREVFRVLKPGGHVIAFGGTRTYHRLAAGIEDAGFEIRDQIQWLYGSGFPKSHDVSKGIDRAAGAEREIVAQGKPVKRMIPGADQHKEGWEKTNGREFVPSITAPATAQAQAWEGWGTALKPACEPIVLARKPLSESTVAANVLKWGTGALNIDGCRAAVSDVDARDVGRAITRNVRGHDDGYGMNRNGAEAVSAVVKPEGRWPANVIHDGSEEVVEAFPDAPGQQYYVGPERGDRPSRGIYGDFGARPPNEPRNDSGSAARFFYTAKADADDRLGSKHPTVKPLDLIQYMVRLVTPPKGLVLDLFAGTGTTGEAAWREGFNAVLIEREAEYQDDIRRRMALCLAGPDERAREAIKARTKDKPVDAGPLFGGS